MNSCWITFVREIKSFLKNILCNKDIHILYLRDLCYTLYTEDIQI